MEKIGSTLTETLVINARQLRKEIRHGKNSDYTLFMIQPQADMTKAERQNTQNWDNLANHPLYDILIQFRDTVFSETIPVDSMDTTIEHEIKPKPNSFNKYLSK